MGRYRSLRSDGEKSRPRMYDIQYSSELPMSRHELVLFADYHQFYIQDENADGNLSDA